MNTVSPFQERAAEYDAWFEKNCWAYFAELRALRCMMPAFREGLEIGVGTGRFAAPFGIRLGVDPSTEMAAVAEKRGVRVVEGVAEKLPFPPDSFDVVLIVTVICFLDDVPLALAEARRVLKPGGTLVIGFLDRDSPGGRRLDARKPEDPFFADAKFVSAIELAGLVTGAGFEVVGWRQTIFGDPGKTSPREPVLDGHGEGLFVALAARC